MTVQVIGGGRVKSTQPDDAIVCGDGRTDCYAAFTADVELTADLTHDDWTFDHWEGDCAAEVTNVCNLPVDSAEHKYDAVAYYTTTGPSPGTSTLTVSYTGLGTVVGGKIPDDGGNPDPTLWDSHIKCGETETVPATDPTTTDVWTDCSWTVLTGSTLAMRATADAGYVFQQWGNACNKKDAECTVVMDANKSLSADFVEAPNMFALDVEVQGSGRVDGGGIHCQGPASCSVNEPEDSTVTLEARPDSGYTFTGWTGDCVGLGDTCTLTMSTARSVAAKFDVAQPTLSVTVAGNGNVSGGSGAINCGNGGLICSAKFAQNATVTLVASPATGATFAGWTGACGGTSTTCTVLMNQSKSVTATFTGGAAGTGFALSVSVSGSGAVTGGGISCGNGATACSANQTPNASVTLTATPAAGATFNGWGGACAGITATTCTVLMNAAKSVTASFSTTGGTGGSTFLLSVSVSGSGNVAGSGISCGSGATTCSRSVPSGTTVTLTATPAAGATFTGWGGACSGTAPTCTVLMSSTRSVTATFTAAAPGTVSITVNGRGTVATRAGRCIGTGPAKTCVQKLTGRPVTLTATPASGQVFGGWSGACASAGKKLSCTLTLAAARFVTATFTAAGTGGGTPQTGAVLSSRGVPIVRRTATGFRVTLRFNTTPAGLARVRGLRAGRVAVALALRVGAGPATIGPFQVSKPGLYTFEIRLGGRTIHWRTCLGRCGRLAPKPNFVLARGRPTVIRSGDAWSVTLHLRANQISAARAVALRGTRKLVDQRFLAKTGAISVGPFLLGPGAYTLRLTATDAYGRTRTLTWVVSLAR